MGLGRLLGWTLRWSGWAASGAVAAGLAWWLGRLAASAGHRDWGPTAVREGRRPGAEKEERDPVYDTFYQLNSARVLPSDGSKGQARFLVSQGSDREDEYATLNSVNSDRALPADQTQPTAPADKPKTADKPKPADPGRPRPSPSQPNDK